MSKKHNSDDVLRYIKGRKSPALVRRSFIEWRSQQNPPRPMRCDEESCIFYEAPLIWSGKELKLILDHENGVNGDDRPENLRFLCPNCNSQQPTHGGGNKGKVEQSEGGFAQIREDGKRDHTLPAQTGKYFISGSSTQTMRK